MRHLVLEPHDSFRALAHLSKAKVRGEFKVVADILPVDNIDLHGHSAAIADLKVVTVGTVHLIKDEGVGRYGPPDEGRGCVGDF